MKGEALGEVVAALPVRPDAYCRRLVEAVERHQRQADELVAAAAIGWEPERMALVDRLVLRLATAELLEEGGPPPAVVLDEAVELAKVYSTEASGAFVNGVLSAVVRALGQRGDEPPS
jgi:N utilization substance protein B